MQQFDEIRREEGSVYCQSLLLMLMSSASTPLVHTVKPNINLIYLGDLLLSWRWKQEF